MSGTPQSDQNTIEELVLEDEARLALELDGAYVGLFEWDVLNNASKWSRGFYRLHGLESNGPASYEVWRAQVHPNDLERVEAEIRKAVEGTDYLDTDYRIVHPDGRLRWTSLRARVKRDANGRASVLSGYCGDVTRRKLADTALLESEKLAIAGRMSAALAHEINNPLEAAYNLLYLARGSAADPEQADLLDQTIEQLQRVSEISHQTLRFVRPSQPRWVDATEVVNSTVRLLRPKLQAHAVEVITDFRGGAQLWCAPGELQQILTNILNNAAEASREPRKLAVRVRMPKDAKTRRAKGARITITDTGPGMSPETLRRLREPFFTTKEGSGTGLGMWVVQELVAKRQGTVSVRSSTQANRHGTTVSIFLPTPGIDSSTGGRPGEAFESALNWRSR